ncbi:MAG TPA: ester cyclase [Kofleriaceae bacterium]|nr:ester cyclase [Kofleriaceae bacterium]
MIDIIKKHLADYSASKWDDYKSALSNNATYEEIATGTRVKGPDEVVKAVQKWKRAFPDLRANVLNAKLSGDTVICEVQWEGTHTGPLDGPFGTIQATNKRGTVKAVEVFRLEKDKIVEVRHYFDLLTVLSQMGIAPMAGAGIQQPGAGATATPPTRHP